MKELALTSFPTPLLVTMALRWTRTILSSLLAPQVDNAPMYLEAAPTREIESRTFTIVRVYFGGLDVIGEGRWGCIPGRRWNEKSSPAQRPSPSKS